MIDSDEMIFYKDLNTKKIYSGGVKIDSILLNSGISPIISSIGGTRELNKNEWNNLVIPNWVLTYDYPKTITGGGTHELNKKENKNNEDENENNTEEVSETISDELYDNLLNLVSVSNKKKSKKKINKNNMKTKKVR